MSNLTPNERRRALEQLRQMVPSLPQFRGRGNPGADFLDRYLAQAARLQVDQIVFELHRDGKCSVNGIVLQEGQRKAAALAWAVFAGARARLPWIQVQWLPSDSKRPRKAALALLGRLANRIERQHPSLANAVRSIKAPDGELVLDRPTPWVIPVSPALSKICQLRANPVTTN